jgi:hypothetical protein
MGRQRRQPDRRRGIHPRHAIARLHSLGSHLLTYVRSNRGAIVNYGKHYRAGLRVATTLAEPAVNSLVGNAWSRSSSGAGRCREQSAYIRFPLTERKKVMARETPRDPKRTPPIPASEEQLPESARDTENAQPVDQGRVPPVRSRDEANIETDDFLPSDEEEQSIADNPAREEVRFGEVKTPGKD